MTPITRKEQFYNAILNGTEAPKPVTREEQFWDAILNGTEPPAPITREEMWLSKIAANGGGGGGGGGSTATKLYEKTYTLDNPSTGGSLLDSLVLTDFNPSTHFLKSYSKNLTARGDSTKGYFVCGTSMIDLVTEIDGVCTSSNLTVYNPANSTSTNSVTTPSGVYIFNYDNANTLLNIYTRSHNTYAPADTLDKANVKFVLYAIPIPE